MSTPQYKWIAAGEIKTGDVVKFAGTPCKVTFMGVNSATRQLHISVEQETSPGIPETTYIVETWQELEVLQPEEPSARETVLSQAEKGEKKHMNPFVLVGTRMTTNQLTDEELAALYMAATAGFDPTGVMGYEKAKSLFTENDGTKMHSDTLSALDIIVGERLAK